jgi:hypothetical protein
MHDPEAHDAVPTLDDATRRFGERLGVRIKEVARAWNGSGFSVWCDFETTIHVYFFGYRDPAESSALSDLARKLYGELGVDGSLQVDFFATNSEADDALQDAVRQMELDDTDG